MNGSHKIFTSGIFLLGGLPVVGLLFYLATSAWPAAAPYSSVSAAFWLLLPVCLFLATASGLFFYCSQTFQKKTDSSVVGKFSPDRYDYRHLWMTFPERVGGALDLHGIFQKLSDFLAETMLVRQIVVWLPSNGSRNTFDVAYRRQEGATEGVPAPIYFEPSSVPEISAGSASFSAAAAPAGFPPSLRLESLNEIGVDCVVAVRNNGALVGFLGVGKKLGGKPFVLEDQRLLGSIASQLANLILTCRLSAELLEAREWESFNRVSSFLIHDLKNLATQQSMVLQNARDLGDNPEFIRDAFGSFAQTTEKMIHLIANLSVQKNQIITRHESVDVVELLKNTFDDLKLEQRKGVQLVLDVPRKTSEPTVSGDPELLQKAFTNVLLNAVQSLPEGEGTIEVSVHKPNGKVVTAVSDTGQGIHPDTLKNLFRPFRSTKKGGMGIGLCHTRTIVESHGGRIRVESEPRKGTKVEIELPAN